MPGTVAGLIYASEKYGTMTLKEVLSPAIELAENGFIVGNENIYLTTDHGLLIVIDILTGKAQSVLKVDNRKKISRPFALDRNLFIIKNDAILKLN